MKPANFPGRKNVRRTNALKALVNRKDKTPAQLAEIVTIELRLNAQAYMIRSKKTRVGKARL